jgi:penicillin-binding protein 1C
MEMKEIVTCKKSGARLSANCEDADTAWISLGGLELPPCAFHKVAHLSPDQKFQVHSECVSVSEIRNKKWFVLPPVQEHYYRQRHVSYRSLPPLREDCQQPNSVMAMDMIYPRSNARIFIPREIDGKPGSSVFELAHRNPEASVYWHLDGEYIGSTKKIHHLPLNPEEGKHVLTIVDEKGESLERHFEVISKMR